MERVKRFFIGCFITIVLMLITLAFSGCRSRPLIIDTGYFDRVRYEFGHLREEHNQLQQAYRQLAESSIFFIEFHRKATERIESGLGELYVIGTDSLSEIQRLRELVGILRGIISGIIEASASTGER